MLEIPSANVIIYGEAQPQMEEREGIPLPQMAFTGRRQEFDMDTRRPGKEIAEDGQTSGGDSKDEIYEKLKSMKAMYYYPLTRILKKTTYRLKQVLIPPKLALLAKGSSYEDGAWDVSFANVAKFEDLPQGLKANFKKVEKFKSKVEHLLAFLQLPKEAVTPGFKPKMAAYEKYLRKLMSTRLITIEQSDGGDWQEEVYQKIQAMKEKHFSKLDELSKRIYAKLMGPDGPPPETTMSQVPFEIAGETVNSLQVTLARPLYEGTTYEQYRSYKKTRVIVKKIMSLLEIPKEGVTRDLKDKWDTIEQQIKGFINAIPPNNQNEVGN
ncbi:hypothetical protein ACFE04_031551 [Oxalis oulophora]